MLSGLALAGANARRSSPDGHDDGLLTAEEVAGLPLQGTGLAVLSACETGIGTLRTGEGTFGLRRAFELAGAHTVVMSLWPVDDVATRDWMTAFYDARLGRSRSVVDAVRDASRSLLDDRRRAGRSDHPFYWASFVAAGAWR